MQQKLPHGWIGKFYRRHKRRQRGGTLFSAALCVGKIGLPFVLTAADGTAQKQLESAENECP
jgi:hypothetical protein